MSSFGDWVHEKLDRLGILPRCIYCGNDHIDELSMTWTLPVQLMCRQDDENIRAACQKRIGWRVIDFSKGKVIDCGPGITMTMIGDSKQ